MPQTINTNIASLNAQRNLNTSQSSLATSMERLSSGLRVNSAKDDAAGLAIAIPIAWATSRLMESFLFGTKPNDPRTIAAAAVILLVAAVIAGYGPARRASRVDPMTTLRHE